MPALSPMLLLLLLLHAAPPRAGAARLRAADAQWQGRTMVDAAAGSVTFAWEGTRATVVFSGASTLTATVRSQGEAAARLRVVVDGLVAPAPLSVGGGGTLTLASGLSAAAQHTVTLWAITDPITLSWPYILNGSTTVLSFDTDAGGAFGPNPPPPARRLRIVGDSITAGNQISNVTCEDDHYYTYGAKLCSYFGADCQTQAISGKGLYENCCDGNETMVAIAERTLPGDAAALYDDGEFIPDGIILALGTNDSGHAGGNASWIAGFTAAYADYLVHLATRAGNLSVPIFCAVGPITHVYQPWVQAAMAAAALRGVRNTQLLSFVTPVDRCGHPDYDGHEAMFQTAKPTIAAALGWTPVGRL